jgi:hypothetical protein
MEHEAGFQQAAAQLELAAPAPLAQGAVKATPELQVTPLLPADADAARAVFCGTSFTTLLPRPSSSPTVGGGLGHIVALYCFRGSVSSASHRIR